MYRCAVVVSGFLMTWFCIASQPPMSQLRGGTADLFTRVVATNAAASIGECTIRMRAWRGERVHAQIVTFFNGATGSVRFVVSSLKSAEGAELPARNLRVRLVRDVAGVPDRLEDAVETAIPSNGFLSAWVTADVSRSSRPGQYEGAVRVMTESGAALSYPVFLEVGVNVLPEQNQFYLDLWQNACAVARYHHVKPYSKAHYALLEPLFRELAAAGQKAITAPICLHPWGKGCLDDEFVPLVKDVRYPDGRCVLDFSDFDAYVAFARSCGIGPQIHCYTILKFAHRFVYYYIDGETGFEREKRLEPGSDDWKAFWRPFLRQFEDHVRMKGWLEDTCIAIDEGDPDHQFLTCAFLKETAPALKYVCAANKDGRKFKGLDAAVYSQILWREYCQAEFLSTLAERRARGQVTTFYYCTQPPHPNTWFKSPLVETAWTGIYAAAAGFDGFLRWAAFHWTADPLTSAVSGYYPAGEVHLLYPSGEASTRWEILRDSIEDYRKIRALRETGRASAALEKALAAIDFESAKTDDEATYRRKVDAVCAQLDGSN